MPGAGWGGRMPNKSAICGFLQTAECVAKWRPSG